MKLSVIYCARNQRETILDELDDLGRASDGWQVERVVVDNYSSDGTREVLRTLDGDDINVIYLPRQRHLSACLRAAMNHLSGDYALLPHNPNGNTWAVLPDLLDGAQGEATAIYSAPDASAKRRGDLLTWLVNLLNGGNVADVLGAYKLVRVDTLKALNLKGIGAQLDVDLTVKLLRMGADIREIASAANARPRSRADFMSGLLTLLGTQLAPSPVWRSSRPSI